MAEVCRHPLKLSDIGLIEQPRYFFLIYCKGVSEDHISQILVCLQIGSAMHPHEIRYPAKVA